MKIMRRIIIVCCLFLLVGCGLSSTEKKEVEKDKERAISLATSYIKDKYDIELNVEDIYGISKTFALSVSYDGDIIVKSKDHTKEFYVWVNVKEKICKDNYQTSEIVKDIEEYLKQTTKGSLVNLYLTTRKGKNEMKVLDKKVNHIFNNGAFFEKKYDKKDFYEYLSYADIEIVTTGADLKMLSDDILNKANQFKNEGSLFVSDFRDIQVYKYLREEYKGDEDSIECYGTLLDESLIHRYLNDQEVSEESISKDYHQYKKYKKDEVDNLTIGYSDQANISIQSYDTQKMFEEVNQRLDTKTLDKMKSQTIKQCFKLSTKKEYYSGELILDGRGEDREIYCLSFLNNKSSYYSISTKYSLSDNQAHLFFGQTINNDVYLVVVEKKD